MLPPEWAGWTRVTISIGLSHQIGNVAKSAESKIKLVSSAKSVRQVCAWIKTVV